jgi:hypothetical protein
MPNFDPRSYGVTKIPEVIGLLGEGFALTKFPGKGHVNIVAYKPREKVNKAIMSDPGFAGSAYYWR